MMKKYLREEGPVREVHIRFHLGIAVAGRVEGGAVHGLGEGIAVMTDVGCFRARCHVC